MKLYFSKGSCSLAIRILINKLNLVCEYEAVDLATKKTATGADFLMINPKGAVPTLVTTAGQVLTENNVIQQYLADTHHALDLLPAVNDVNRYQVLALANFISTELHKGCSPFFNPMLPSEVKEQIFMPALQKKLAYIETKLTAGKDYLIAEHFTLPDAYLFTVLRWMPSLKIDLTPFPNTLRYFQTMKKLPFVEKSLAEEGIN